jgi:cytoskeletal protein CcmA (bactofilin family)
MADTETTANQTPNEANGLESLEDQDSTLVNDNTDQTPSPPPVAPPEHNGQFERLRQRTNIYLLLFGAVILLAGIIILIAYLQDQHSAKTNRLQTQSLSQSTLQQLANSDATVGSNQSVLNVQSSAVFAGQVLIRQNLEIAGNLQIGGTLALSNLTVSGTSQFGQATVNQNLAVAGNTAIQGATTIAKSLQVNGSGTFSGPLSAPQITTSSLQLNGDLVLTHHISVGGSTPTRSGGTALGSGGSVSISGSDTAGSISVNTGSSPAAGCFVTITFTTKYNATPHVLVTPIGSAAGGLSYYVDRSTTNFSICDSTTPPTGNSFGFDYFVLD